MDLMSAALVLQLADLQALHTGLNPAAVALVSLLADLMEEAQAAFEGHSAHVLL